VDGLLREAARGEKLKHALTQEIDRTHLAIEAFADHFHDSIELGLRVAARGHHLVEADQYVARSGDRRAVHDDSLAQWNRFGNAPASQRGSESPFFSVAASVP
jgi:hypothetical protein